MQSTTMILRIPRYTKAQANLEMTLALICAFVLLFAGLRLFTWLNDRLIRRQDDFRDSRITSGFATQRALRETSYPALNLSVYVPK